MKEVEKHNKASDIWIVIDKKVYDVTKYLNNVILMQTSDCIFLVYLFY